MSEFDPHSPQMQELIAATLAGAPAVIGRLDALTASASGAGVRAARLRLLVALVNVRRLAEARELVAREGWESESFAQQPARSNVPLNRFEIDALFALGVMDNEPGGNATLARRRFTRATTLMRPAPGGEVDASFWSAVHGTVITSDRLGDFPASAEALLLAFQAAGCDLAMMPAELAALWPDRARDQYVRLVLSGESEKARAFVAIPGIAALLDAASAGQATNVAVARAQLEASPGGDPVRARRHFQELREALDESHHLFWPALRGELAAIARVEGEAAAASLARELLVGRDPATVPHDLAARARGGDVKS